MSYKITKQRLAEIVKEEMDAYFGTLEEEGKKPDFADIDGDGDKEEDMSDAAEDKKDKKEGTSTFLHVTPRYNLESLSKMNLRDQATNFALMFVVLIQMINKHLDLYDILFSAYLM